VAGMKANISAKMVSHRPERERELMGKLGTGLQKAVLAVERQAKINAEFTQGYQTGRLRSSITNRIEGSTGIVGTNVEYANFVEHGTDKMGAQPFLFPALEQVRAKIAEFFK